MVEIKLVAVVLAVAFGVLSACSSTAHRGPVAMPTPSTGDTEGQVMSVTGAGFTLCGISDDGPSNYDVTVCGSMDKARSALNETSFASLCTLHAYQAGDDGSHTPQELVMQWWIWRVTGTGFTVTSTQIAGNGTIDVGVDGDLAAARTALDRQFPGWTEVHEESGLPAAVLTGVHRSAS